MANAVLVRRTSYEENKGDIQVSEYQVNCQSLWYKIVIRKKGQTDAILDCGIYKYRSYDPLSIQNQEKDNLTPVLHHSRWGYAEAKRWIELDDGNPSSQNEEAEHIKALKATLIMMENLPSERRTGEYWNDRKKLLGKLAAAEYLYDRKWNGAF